MKVVLERCTCGTGRKREREGNTADRCRPLCLHCITSIRSPVCVKEQLVLLIAARPFVATSVHRRRRDPFLLPALPCSSSSPLLFQLSPLLFGLSPALPSRLFPSHLLSLLRDQHPHYDPPSVPSAAATVKSKTGLRPTRLRIWETPPGKARIRSTSSLDFVTLEMCVCVCV